MVCLDTVISIREDRYYIKTSLFVKPTDSASYLHYRSAHPRHCIKGIPYGQFLRIRRICSDDADFFESCVTKGRHFVRRGYPPHFVANAFYKVSQQTRESLLSPKPKKDPQRGPKYSGHYVHPRLQKFNGRYHMSHENLKYRNYIHAVVQSNR